MKMPIMLSVAALVATPTPLASKAPTTATVSQSFPAEFRGNWFGKPGPCNPDNLALQVGDVSLNYFDEFSGRLTRIIRRTGRSVHYTAEYSAEGRVWDATETLRLSPNGKEMTLEPDRTASRYYRCARTGAN